MPIIWDESAGQQSISRRSHQPDAADAPMLGLESIISYNGLLLNDFRFFDRYQVTEITGLDDADVRDSREERPDSHGESPFNAFYGGRTITIRGKIIAGNWARLRKMISNLKEAFGTLEEKELSFCYRDWDYTTFDQSWTDDFLLSSSANISISSDNEYLTYSTTAARTALLDFKGVHGPDLETIHEFVTGTAPVNAIRGIVKGVDASNHIQTTIGSNIFLIQTTIAGANATVTSVSFFPNANTTYWFRTNIEGDNLTSELWDEYPSDEGTPIHRLETVLTSTAKTLFGALTTGYPGWEMAAGVGDNTYKVGGMSVRNLGAKADYSIKCRKSGKLELGEQQNNLHPRRDFMVTLRSSEPTFTSRSSHMAIANISIAALTFPASGGLTFPAEGGLSFLSGSSVLGPTNRGNFLYNPIIRIEGTCFEPAILNTSSGQGLSLNGLSLVSATSYVTINCRDKTIVDNAGNNLYSYMSEDSDWIQVLPGVNAFYGGTTTGTPELKVWHKSSWL